MSEKPQYDYVQECLSLMLHDPDYRKATRRLMRKLVREAYLLAVEHVSDRHHPKTAKMMADNAAKRMIP